MLNRRRCDGMTRRNALELGLGGFLGTSFVGGLKARAESQHGQPYSCRESQKLYSDLDGRRSDSLRDV
jgi:hypothetical protein